MTDETKHIKPNPEIYDGGYTTVRECFKCKTVQLETKDLNCVCKECGQKGHFSYAARWVSTAIFFKPSTWYTGFWQKPEGSKPMLGDPTPEEDATTKSYVDSQLQ